MFLKSLPITGAYLRKVGGALAPGTLIIAVLIGVAVAPAPTKAGGDINFPSYTCTGCNFTVQDINLPPEVQAPQDTNSTTVYVGTPATQSAGGSIQVNVQPVIKLDYAWNRWWNTPQDSPSNFPTPDNSINGYVTGLSNPNVTVGYDTSVTDVAGNPISQGGTVTQGQVIKLIFKPFVDHNIAWFGTGYSMDSPYGHWQSGATAPARVSNKTTCNADDFVVTTTVYGWNFDVYVPLQVNQPTISLTNTSGLTGCTSALQGDGSTVYTCTVGSTGSLAPTFNWSSTYGKFYYRYYDYRNGTSGGVTIPLLPGCYGNNIPLADENILSGNTVEPGYSVAIPGTSLTYNLTSSLVSNNPPNLPTITGPTTGTPTTVYNYTITATDPDNDTVDYLVDWNNDGVADASLPASGYVPSGTGQSGGHSWSSPGTYTFKARAQDSKGALSAWASYSVTIAAPVAATGSLTASPTTVTVGGSTTLTYTCTGATSGTLIDNNTSGSLGAVNVDGAPHTVSTTPSSTDSYTLTCVGAGGNGTAVANVTVKPALAASCSATTNPITAGGSTTFSGLATGGTGPYTYNWTASGGTPSSGSATPPTGTASTITSSYSTPGTYTTNLYVTDSAAANTSVNCTVTVNPAPNLQAGAVTPQVADPFSTTNFTATISNVGAGSTGGSFTDLIQKATDSSGTGKTDWFTVSNGALGPSASNVATFSGSTPSGIWYLRVCADKSSDTDTGVIPETSEGDNCGPWSKVVASPDFTADVTLPTTATQNVPVNFTSTMTNIGTPFSGPMSDVFQIGVGGPYAIASPTSGNPISLATNASMAFSSGSAGMYTFTSPGSYQVRGCANMSAPSGVFPDAEADYTNNCGPWQTVTVAAANPDITATTTPLGSTTFAAKTAQTFTGTVGNVGNASATNVPNVLQVLDSTGTNSLGYFTAGTSASIGVNGTVSVSGTVGAGSAPFTSPGTYKVRFCGNMNTGGSNVITEGAGQYGNNCGPALTVSVTVPVVTLTFPSHVIQKGSATTLSWNATNATSCTGFNFSTGNATSGSVPISPTYSTRYRVTCTDAGGNLASDKGSVAVQSAAPRAPLVSATLNASPEQFTSPGTSTLTWGSTNATSCTSNDFATAGATSGSVSVSPTVTTSYEVSCTNGTDTANDGATVVVNGVPPTDTADLSATDVTPVTATAGSGQIYTATVTDGGLASTGTSYNNLFQFDGDANHTTVDATQVVVAGPTAANGTTAVSSTAYTFTSAGTGYVRLCADNNASFVGSINEIDENNNCGPWTSIAVSAAPIPLSTTCSVNPASAITGSSVVWTAYPAGGSAPYTYSWTAPSGSPSSGTLSTLTNSYASAGTYGASVTVHDALSNATTTACTTDGHGYATVTVSTPNPDIRGDAAPAQNTAVAGTPQSFTSTVTNIGNATGTNFPNVLQILDSTGTVNVTRVLVSPNPITLAGGTTTSATLTGTYTFPAAGTFKARICGNSDVNGTNIITEGAGQYGNDCGAMQTVTVSPAPVPLTVTCTPSPTSASTGGSVVWGSTVSGGTAPYTYSWTATGGSPSSGTLSTLTNSYATPGTYSGSLTVKDAVNTSSTVACTSSVTVSTPPTGSLVASPTSINYGANSTLTYSCSNSANAAIDQGALATTSTLSGAPVVTPNSSTTYTLTCTNASGLTAKYPATVTVTPEPDITSTSTPTGATSFAPNTAQTFNGTVGNIGTAVGSNVPSVLKVLNSAGTSVLAYVAASPATTNLAANGGGAAISGTFTATTTGTFLIEFCGNQNTSGVNVITEKTGGYGNNCSSPLSVNVAVATAPDIRGDGAPPQTSATVNVSQAFTGTVTNIGNATGTNFPNVLQILDSTGTTNIARVLATPGPITLAGGTTTSPTLTGSYTFTSSGTYQVRFCGNMDTTGTQIITEGVGQYGNDCGATQTVMVSATGSGSIAYCTPSPSTTATGTPVTWTASTTNLVIASTTYTWSVSGGTPANQNGSPITFTSTFQNGGDYSPTVSATDGTHTAAPFSCSSVHINGPSDTCSLPTTPTITASQTRITPGSSVVLNWSATGVTSGTTCTVTGANVGGSNINTTTTTTADNLCDVNSSTNTTTITNITTQQVFTITCGVVSKQVVVDILPSFNEF